MKRVALVLLLAACAPKEKSWKWAEVALSPKIKFQRTGLALDTGSHFDSCHAKYPSIVKVEEVYFMFYSARTHDCKTGSIGLATSLDGIQWEKQGKVFSPARETAYGRKADHPSVLFDGKFRMWFSQQDSEDRWSIGYAESIDGIQWNYVGTVMEGVFHPTVLKQGETYHMFYNEKSGFILSLTHATSLDGINWIRDGSFPLTPSRIIGIDELYIYNAAVLEIDGVFHMWYSALALTHLDGSPNSSCIVHAESFDLQTWQKDLSATVCNNRPGTLDSFSTYAPFILNLGGRLTMFYSGESSDGKNRTFTAEAL